MYISETKLRVRYGETDQMGYVYYGNYPLYYEVARTEMIRKLGWPYKKIEESGVMLPVLTLNVKYIKPALYDDELTIKTIVRKLPSARIEFEYEVYNEKNELINKGDTSLVFVNMKTMKPTSAPQGFLDDIKKYFE